MKILVGISGASGAHLGILLANAICDCGYQTHAIITQNAKISMQKEEKLLQLNKNIVTYDNNEISAAPASGSAKFEKMIIAPCSINSLAKISCGIADLLLTRAAAVMLKEGRKLILAVREMPLSAISLKQMSDLASLGVCMASPIVGYYCLPKTIEDIENFIISKWLDCLEIQHDLYKRWE